MANIPDRVKKNVRAVLLSKQGGVLVSNFTKDYKALLQEPLHFKDLGFTTIKEFIDAIPDVVRYVYVYWQFQDNCGTDVLGETNVTSEWRHNEMAIVFDVKAREDVVFCPP